MAKVITTELQHSGASGANITLDSSKNVTVENNLTVDGTTTLTGAVTLPAGTTSDTLSFRNLLYNGDCRIAQRGTSSTTNGFNTIDRWKTYTTSHSVTVTASQQSLSSSDTGPWAKGFRKYSRIALSGAGTAAAGTQMFTFQPLEAQDIANSGWDYTSSSSYLQLSFWVRSSTAQAFPISLYTKDGTEKLYTTTYTVSSANTWEKKTIQIPGATGLQFDNDTGEGIRIYLACPYHGTDFTSAASDATWVDYAATKKFVAVPSTWLTAGASTLDFTGAQLEVGSSATEYEMRSYAEEERRCQRYFFSLHGENYISGRVSGGSGFEGSLPTTVPMRAQPSVALTATTGSATCTTYSSNNKSAQTNAFTTSNWREGQCHLGVVQPSSNLHTDDRAMILRIGSGCEVRLDAEL